MQERACTSAPCASARPRAAPAPRAPDRAPAPAPRLHPSPHGRRRALPRAAAARAAAAPDAPPAATAAAAAAVEWGLACPICFVEPLAPGAPRCPRCARTFAAPGPFLDLTLASGAPGAPAPPRAWGGQTLFQNRLVSGVYERGWRQSFAWAGFPGADAEFQLAMARLGPAFGGTLLDLSCGSGIFSRLFAKSGRFAGVIAADFSEAMLREAAATFAADAAARGGPHLLVRADAARLPFAAGSLGAVHAGAALHCWPDAATAVAEVARVLRPGGAFVASTFLTAAAPLGALLGDDAAVRPLGRLLDGPPGARPMRWWDEGELRGLCAAAGLVGFERERRNRFILFSARKPNRGGDGGDGNESN